MIVLKVKDFSVSQEIFELHQHPQFEMLQTKPVPDSKSLPKYYQTEEYISHTDRKKTLLELVYHLVRTVTLKRKVSLINSFSKKGTLLDIGAGTGDFLAQAKKNGWHVTGIEINEKARAIANTKLEGCVQDAQTLNTLPKHSFDIITLWHVLEHLPDPQQALLLYKSLLKPEGTLIIAVPNYKSYDASYYKHYWAAYDVPRHLWHFSKEAIVSLTKEINMQLHKILPMKFDAYYVSLLSEKYKTGSMNPFKAFRIGFLSNYKAKKHLEYSSHIYIIKND